MSFAKNKRVNIVITNHALRYTYNKTNSVDGVAAYGEAPLLEGIIKDGTILKRPALQKVIKQLVHRHKWKRKKLYFCVPDDTVVVRELTIPASLTEAEAIAYVKTQLGNSIYLPFANPALALEFLEMDHEKRNILIFAYPKAKITAFEDIFVESGLKPAAADLTSLSVYRYCYRQMQEEKDHVLLIHWNQDALVLTAFHQHKAIFTRYMKMPASDMVIEMDEVSAKQLIHDHAIEINRIIDFYRFSISKGEAGIDRLLLTGDFPFLQIARSILSETITVPFYNFPEGNYSKKFLGKYIDVLGLALKK